MRSRYIGFDGIEVPGHTLNKKPLNGYKVIYQPSGCLWRITEMYESVSTGLEIKFWPSSNINTVNWLKYEKTGLDMWYSVSGKLEYIAHNVSGKKHGESYEYSPKVRKFYFEGIDITSDVLLVIENREVLTNEDKFNLFIKYGSEFKLHEEYIYDPNLTEIIKICSKK